MKARPHAGIGGLLRSFVVTERKILGGNGAESIAHGVVPGSVRHLEGAAEIPSNLGILGLVER